MTGKPEVMDQVYFCDLMCHTIIYSKIYTTTELLEITPKALFSELRISKLMNMLKE